MVTPVHDPRFLLAVSEAHDALNHAENKHPNYNYSPLRKVGIIVEEAGEAMRAVLQMYEAGEQPRCCGREMLSRQHEIREEVAQCAAMCLRYLMGEQR